MNSSRPSAYRQKLAEAGLLTSSGEGLPFTSRELLPVVETFTAEDWAEWISDRTRGCDLILSPDIRQGEAAGSLLLWLADEVSPETKGRMAEGTIRCFRELAATPRPFSPIISYALADLMVLVREMELVQCGETIHELLPPLMEGSRFRSWRDDSFQPYVDDPLFQALAALSSLEDVSGFAVRVDWAELFEQYRHNLYGVECFRGWWRRAKRLGEDLAAPLRALDRMNWEGYQVWARMASSIETFFTKVPDSDELWEVLAALKNPEAQGAVRHAARYYEEQRDNQIRISRKTLGGSASIKEPPIKVPYLGRSTEARDRPYSHSSWKSRARQGFGAKPSQATKASMILSHRKRSLLFQACSLARIFHELPR